MLLLWALACWRQPPVCQPELTFWQPELTACQPKLMFLQREFTFLLQDATIWAAFLQFSAVASDDLPFWVSFLNIWVWDAALLPIFPLKACFYKVSLV